MISTSAVSTFSSSSLDPPSVAGLNSHVASVGGAGAAIPTPNSSLFSAIAVGTVSGGGLESSSSDSDTMTSPPFAPPAAAPSPHWYCVVSIVNGGTSAMSRRLQNDRASVLFGDTRLAGGRPGTASATPSTAV
jgi:hypothetical protein